jgi:type 1 glutamine amidotransferase
MSGYDWSKVMQYPPLREQMKEIIAWANRRAEEQREQTKEDESLWTDNTRS